MCFFYLYFCWKTLLKTRGSRTLRKLWQNVYPVWNDMIDETKRVMIGGTKKEKKEEK